MIYVIHGADVVASRKRLGELRSAYSSDDIQSFSAKDIEYSQFPLLFTTLSMFGEKRAVIVEGKLDAKQVDVKLVAGSDVDLIVWAGEKLRANDGLLTMVKEAKGQVDFFEDKVDLTIFPFLDAVASRSRRAALAEYMKLMKSKSEPIYLLTMLVWQFRNIIVPENASGFVQKKALDSKNRFSFDELRKIYYQLLQMDIAMKTGDGVPEVLLEQFILKVTK